MTHRYFSHFIAICVVILCACNFSLGHTVEVFAKASASKNYSTRESYTVSISGATGLGIVLFPQVRLEGRYTLISSLQNRLDVTTDTGRFTLHDFKTQTNIYSAGLDIDLLSDKHAIQPFIFVGAGYIETVRSYFVPINGAPSLYIQESKETGISTNVGAGIRIRIAKSVAFEVEAYGYGMNIHKPNPLINLYATAGIRIFM